MKVKLVIVSPEVSPNEYDVVLPAKIGRGHEAKLKLVHPLVSRLHCELLADGERVVIRDLDSLNGTFVDQQRIDKDTPLASGATVMMGTVMFQVRYGKDADRLPPRPAVKMEKTAAAAGTVRQETLNKISKRDSGVSDEDQRTDRVEDPTANVDPGDDPLGLASLDDEGNPGKRRPSRKPLLRRKTPPLLRRQCRRPPPSLSRCRLPRSLRRLNLPDPMTTKQISRSTSPLSTSRPAKSQQLSPTKTTSTSS